MNRLAIIGLSVACCIGLSACATTIKAPNGEPQKIVITPISGAFSAAKCKLTLGKVIEYKGKRYCARRSK